MTVKMVKLDPYKHKEKYLKWKERTQSGIAEMSTPNFNLMKAYLSDMENGMNIAISNKKGSRSFIRLNVLRQRLNGLSKLFKEKFDLDDITQVSEQQIFGLFTDMRNGLIRKADGRAYKSPKHFVKDFKAFWHWWMKVNRKKGIDIKDITLDLDTSGEKPEWVYMTEEDVKKLCNEAKFNYRVLIWFLFDTGIRAPTELMNVKVSDFFNDFKELNIRQETTKTFGRRIKLMLCSNLVREYIKSENLNPDDFVFRITPPCVNKYLKKLAKRVLGDKKSQAGAKYSDLTMYDFRHCSCCYWLPRYKSESALLYRFGWKKSDKIHYYSELLGMKDTINQDDLLTDVTKVELEKRMDQGEKDNAMLREDNEMLKIQMAKIAELTAKIYAQMKLNKTMEFDIPK